MVVMATAAFILARVLTGDFWLACAAGGVVLALMLFSVYAIGDRQD